MSAPFSKSNTSFAKFAPICKSSAPASAASAGPTRGEPSAMATAVPTATGTTAASSVGGRVAISQARGEPGTTASAWDIRASVTGSA